MMMMHQRLPLQVCELITLELFFLFSLDDNPPSPRQDNYSFPFPLSYIQQIQLTSKDLATVFEHELNKVENFFLEKYHCAHAKATAKNRDIPFIKSIGFEWDGLDRFELQELLCTTVELWEDLRKLQWYGKVNRDGSRKILNKMGRIPDSNLFAKLEAQLNMSEFSRQTHCTRDLEKTERFIAELKHTILINQRESTGFIGTSPCFPKRAFTFIPHFNDLNAAIQSDDALAFPHLLPTIEKTLSCKDFNACLITAQRNSEVCKYPLCVNNLLMRVDAADSGYFISRFIRMTGRELSPKLSNHHAMQPVFTTLTDATSLFAYILHELPPNLRYVLYQTDSFGCTPLHIAAEYGLEGISREILRCIKGWGHNSSMDRVLLHRDTESNTPLHLAALGSHLSVVKMLLEYLMAGGLLTELTLDCSFIGDLMMMAVRSGSVPIAKVLLIVKSDLNYASACGETPLFVAARSGDLEMVRLLLTYGADVNFRKSLYAWTPFMIACVNGDSSMVRLLVDAGADQIMRDHQGWTAKDHAAFRGHIPLAKTLASDPEEPRHIYKEKSKHTGKVSQLQSALNVYQAQEQSSIWLGMAVSTASSPNTRSHIFVNLGSHNKIVTAVDLSPYTSNRLFSPYPDIDFAVRVSAVGADGQSHTLQLPILEALSNRPWVFSTDSIEMAILVFEILRIIPDSEDIPIGSGVAVLRDMRQNLGISRESLMRDHTVSILSRESMRFMGTVTFNLLVVKPTWHPELAPTLVDELWTDVGPSKVVGHRCELIRFHLVW